MAKKHSRTEKRIAGDPLDPIGMYALLKRYFESLVRREYAAASIYKCRIHLNDFIDWAAERDVVQPAQVTHALVESYQRHLMHQIDNRGKTFSFRNQASRIGSLRVWFKWLDRNEHIDRNPTDRVELPRVARRLPKNILSHEEVEKVLDGPDVTTPRGLRDRAILETFYSTGVRRMELVRLTLGDLDVDRAVIVVREGKGKKDRTVPIGQRALLWVNRYLNEVRPKLVKCAGCYQLFVTIHGDVICGTQMSKLVKGYIDSAQIGKPGACHLFRHAMATQMLEGGADIRFIQEMLGHENLETTQIYTRVSIRKLQEVHTRTHPARNDRPEGPVVDDSRQ